MIGSESKTPDISAFYQECYRPMEMKVHFHNSFELVYVVEGASRFNINGKIYTVTPKSIVFISNLENHELKVLEYPYKRYCMLIKPEYLNTVLNEPVLISILKYRPEDFCHVIDLKSRDHAGFEEAFRRLYNEINSCEAFVKKYAGTLIAQLFISLYRSFKNHFPLTAINKSTETILKIQNYLENNFTEDVNLNDISKDNFQSMYYISHLFRKVTGFSFREYLILLRLSRAKELLFYTSQDITQVAINSGFNNVNHFIRIFKKNGGITPLQYRKRASVRH